MRRLAILALAVLAAGCSAQTDDPQSRISTAQPSSSAAPVEDPVVKVSQPWAEGMFQHGVAVYWENNPNDTDQIVRAKAQKILDHVVSMGANSVSISFSFVMESATASGVLSDHDITPSPRRLSIVLDEANKRALRTAVRPMLNERNLVKDDPNMWRGSIRPASKQKWFASYRDLLVSYGKVAAEAKVATFVVGTELNSLESYTDGWDVVSEGLRGVYSGELDYSANHDRLRKAGPAEGITRSVDAYPSIKLGDSASVSQLKTGWNAWLTKNRGKGALPDLVLAEVAIGARGGAYKEPWSPHQKGAIKPEIQERWFETACNVMHERNLAGIYFWMINLDADPARKPTAKTPMDFIGRPSEQTVRDCFARDAKRPSP
ncbi:glycoside hydrolase family 113 [Phytohabitans aurantiacus]|uniref:Glycoside hydrolase family 5 domain-containing protein n=1 Tax=Phytohabitans aurantiacus TaxID=3016789 RepID=A0ABQ5R9W0_9ACTN|nr:hypothetical protein [Phytohabitans aurantiacus]GLI03178.1 hypothetical protein Pa4123_84560 [Phytohabitans aurantiacus]